jgi:hypothetical protein
MPITLSLIIFSNLFLLQLLQAIFFGIPTGKIFSECFILTNFETFSFNLVNTKMECGMTRILVFIFSQVDLN